MSRKRVMLLLFGLLILAAAGYALFGRGAKGALQFRFTRLERGPLISTVSSSGTLNAVTTVQVGSQVSGQIKQLFVDFNSPVKREQVIARLDPELFETKVNQAKADLAAVEAGVLNQLAQLKRAEAEVENARASVAAARAQIAKAKVAVLDGRRNLKRRRELFGQALVPESDLNTAEAVYEAAVAQAEASAAEEKGKRASLRSEEAQLKVVEAQLENARALVRQKRASLRQAEVDLGHTVIRAPVDGVVVSRNVDVGQTVAASLQAPTLFVIAQDLTEMQVITNVDEADIGRVRVGQRATFLVDSFVGRDFEGEVLQIRKAPKVEQNVVTYDVVVSAKNSDLALLPGMTANVRIVTDQKEGVLKVPNTALRFRMPADGSAGDPPRAGSGGAQSRRGNGPSPQEIRERLVQDLQLTPAQKQELEAVGREIGVKMRGIAQNGLSGPERGAAFRQARAEARERILAVIPPEKRERASRILAGLAVAQGSQRGQVWTMGADGSPKSVNVRLGISDGQFTEVLSGDFADGQPVIIGVVSPGGRSGARQRRSGLRF